MDSRLLRSTLPPIAAGLKRVMTDDPRVKAAFDGVLVVSDVLPQEYAVEKWRPVDGGYRVVLVRVSQRALAMRDPSFFDRLCLQVEPHALGFGLE